MSVFKNLGKKSKKDKDEKDEHGIHPCAFDAPEGRFFCIESRLNELVVEVRGGSSYPGTPLVMSRKQVGYDDAQLWCEDILTGTIRSKINDYCLDLDEEGRFCIKPYDPSTVNQQWMFFGRKLKNRQSRTIMQIEGESQEYGASVIATSDDEDRAGQQWTMVYKPPRFFYIRSRLHGKVMDINKGKEKEGGGIIVYKQNDHPSDNQLWYEDRRGIIRSKLKNFCLEADEDNDMKTSWPETGNEKQLWKFDGNKVVNVIDESLCLDIKKGSKKDGADVVAFQYVGGENQKWTMDFVDN